MKNLPVKVRGGWVFVLFIGLLIGLLGVLVFGLTFGLSRKPFPEHLSLSSNAGIWRSGKNALIAGSVAGPVGVLIVGLVMGLTKGSIAGLTAGPIAGLLFGLVAGYVAGLDTFVKHFTLRFFLSLRGDLSWKLVPFLDEAVDRLLLRKVGGSYIFVHRLLLDYFAALNKPVSTTSTPPVDET